MILVYINQIYATYGAFRAVREHYKRRRRRASAAAPESEDPSDLLSSPVKLRTTTNDDPLEDPLSSELRSRLKYFVLASSLYAWEGTFEWIVLWFPFYTTVKFLICVLLITRHVEVFDVVFAPTVKDAFKTLSATDATKIFGSILSASSGKSEEILLKAHATPVMSSRKKTPTPKMPAIVTPEPSIHEMMLSLHDDEEEEEIVKATKAHVELYQEQISAIESSLDALSKSFLLPDFSFQDEEEEDVVVVEMNDDDDDDFVPSPNVTTRTPMKKRSGRFSLRRPWSSSKKFSSSFNAEERPSYAAEENDDSFNSTKRDAAREARIQELLREGSSASSKRSNAESPSMRLRSGRRVPK